MSEVLKDDCSCTASAMVVDVENQPSTHEKEEKRLLLLRQGGGAASLPITTAWRRRRYLLLGPVFLLSAVCTLPLLTSTKGLGRVLGLVGRPPARFLHASRRYARP